MSISYAVCTDVTAVIGGQSASPGLQGNMTHLSSQASLSCMLVDYGLGAWLAGVDLCLLLDASDGC